MIKGAIFDLDGVLEYSNDMWVSQYREIAHKVGISGKLSDDEITKNFGEKYEVVLEGLVGKDKLPKAMSLLQEALNSEDWVNKIKPTPHSLEVLEALKKKGIKLAVFSGNSSEVLEKSLKALKIRHYFHAVVSADDVKKMKPAPEGLLKALSSLNLQKSEAIYVGDAINDVKSAKAAGVKVAVVLTGALNRKKAEGVKPDWIIEDLGGFLEILK